MTRPTQTFRTFKSYDGTTSTYAEIGAGPKLVCLPGGPGRASEYLEDLGGLASERTLVRLDMRGTGRSETPSDLTTLRFDRLAADVEALREHLGEQRLDLLAHSAGCIVAQAYAAQYPERVNALVLVTPSDRLQGGSRADVARIRAARSDEPWYAEAAQAAQRLASAPPEQQQPLVRATRPFFYGRWDARARAHAASAETQTSEIAQRHFATTSEDVDVPGMLAKLRALEAPVLVLAGEHDGLTGVAAAELVASSFPRAELEVLAGVGHFPWVDEPQVFRERVAAFLNHR